MFRQPVVKRIFIWLEGSVTLQFVSFYVYTVTKIMQPFWCTLRQSMFQSGRSYQTNQMPNKALPKTGAETHSLRTHLSLNSLTWHLPAKSWAYARTHTHTHSHCHKGTFLGAINGVIYPGLAPCNIFLTGGDGQTRVAFCIFSTFSLQLFA